MKKVYDYHTKQLINESKKNRLNESVSFNDIIETDAKVLHNETELKRAVFSRDTRPLIIWEYSGNRVAQDITDICDAANVDYCAISARSLRGRADELKNIYQGEELILIDEFTFGRTTDVDGLLVTLEDFSTNDVTIVLVGKIDAPNNEYFAEDFEEGFINFIYSPEYDRQTVAADDDDEFAYESVSEKFAKYRKLYESEEDDSDSSDEGSSDDNSSDEGSDDKGSDDTNSDEGSDDKGSDDETEDVPMTAIILTVKKDDVDKCKEELIDAGIPEDAIDEVDTEDDEDGKIKVDADYAIELKDYLKGKGIDLEEKIGGEIVDDSAEGDGEGSEDDKDKSDDSAEGDGKGSGEDDGFDAEFGDLFGDE